MRLTPDLIAHEEFHTGLWLMPVQRPVWYYFLKTSAPPLANGSAFMKSVDKRLRDLVTLLQRAGIRTTPSCSGHDKKSRHFANVYDALRQDMDDIRGAGLAFHDIQTNARLNLRDVNYRLPWSKEEFMTKAEEYQHRGVLGIELAAESGVKKRIIELDIPGVRIAEKGSIVLICTDGERDEVNDSAWKQITRQVRRIVSND